MFEFIIQKIQRKHHRFTLSTANCSGVFKPDLGYFIIWSILKNIISLPRVLVLFTLKILSPLVKLRIGALEHNRIGHLAVNTDLFLRRESIRRPAKREVTFLLSKKNPVNRQLMNMIKRRVRVFESTFWYYLVKGCVMNSDWWANITISINEYDEFNKISPQLHFSAAEEEKGERLFEEIGIPPGQPFICFHARDKSYLDTQNFISTAEWRYHDYRDCDISNYLGAAEHLVSKGNYAIRMGHTVEFPITENNPKIIDYATRCRSDFGDIYLSSKCRFFLGNTAGICNLTYVLKRPIAAANWIPIGVPPLLASDLFIPKKLWHKDWKRFLKFREILESGADMWGEAQQYKKAGIEVIENTTEEILSLAKEMDERLDGNWEREDGDEELQERYRALFKPGHHCYGFPSRIGAEFLRQNQDLLS